jgi:hypothetical protein
MRQAIGPKQRVHRVHIHPQSKDIYVEESTPVFGQSLPSDKYCVQKSSGASLHLGQRVSASAARRERLQQMNLNFRQRKSAASLPAKDPSFSKEDPGMFDLHTQPDVVTQPELTQPDMVGFTQPDVPQLTQPDFSQLDFTQPDIDKATMDTSDLEDKPPVRKQGQQTISSYFS